MASDTLPEDAWVQSFMQSQPRPLLSSLQKRLHASQTHVSALSELYKQRAAIEAQYSDSLQKLVKQAERGELSGKTGNEWERGTGEAKLWDSVLAEISETSSAHSTLAALIRTDFEGGVRELPSKIVSWRRIGEQDASLDKTLKDWEKTSGKLDKAASKSKSGKADQLQGELNQLTQSLSSLSPMVYTTYQRLDEDRLRKLKEMVISWFTAKADAASRDGERAEAAVASLIGWETADEVERVGRRLGGGGSAPPRAAPGGAPSINSATTTPRITRRLSQATTGTNDFSPRPTPRQNGSSGGGGSGFAGGLKSMLGRKPTLAAPSRGRSGSEAPSVRSERVRNEDFETIGEDEPNINLPGRSAATATAPPVDAEGFSMPPAERDRPPWEDPTELVPTPAGTRSGAAAAGAGAGQATFATSFQSSPSASTEDVSGGQGKLNLAMTSAPIEESDEARQAAMQKTQQTLALPPAQPSRRGTTRGRRDVRNTMFGGVGEDGLLAAAGAGAVGAGTLGAATLGDSLGGTTSAPFGTGASGNGPPILARQSSVASVGSNNPFDSPGLAASNVVAPIPAAPAASTGSGLRATLTESINVIMRSNQVQRVQINGEIHLSLRGQTAGGPLHIRLTSFEALEKIAPNPAYLAQVPDKPGEYFLNTEVLASATQRAGAKGTLLFKYQVHVSSGKESGAVPLLLEPIFNTKDGETRMILHYRPNTGAALVPASALTGLSLIAAFAPGVSVSNVQAKPAGGVWSPPNRRMTWQLPTYAGEEGKIIAKFTTEAGEPMVPQGVMATFTVDGALGSGLGIELVDASGAGLRLDEVKKGLITGKYLAEAVMSA